MTPEEFADEHATPLLRLALMLTGRMGDAEDLVQETFVRLLRDWTVIERADAPRAYARRTLLNVHLSGRRRSGREVVLASVPEQEVSSSPAPSDTDEVWALLATLPRRQRCVLVLRYYEDLTDDEIASILHITPGAARTHAARGLATLRARIPFEEVLS